MSRPPAAAARAGTQYESSLSSIDPLALPSPREFSICRSPLRRASANTQKSPVKAMTPKRIPSSPIKTITMSTGKSANAYPWKIKVTIEAEPETSEMNDENEDPFQIPARNARGRAKTVQVPLKDTEDSPAERAQRRSQTPVGKKNNANKRAGTPVRGRRGSIRAPDSDEESPDDSMDRDFTPKSKPRRRQKKSVTTVIPTKQSKTKTPGPTSEVESSAADSPDQLGDVPAEEVVQTQPEKTPHTQPVASRINELGSLYDEIEIPTFSSQSPGPEKQTFPPPSTTEAHTFKSRVSDLQSILDESEFPSFSSVSPYSDRGITSNPSLEQPKHSLATQDSMTEPKTGQTHSFNVLDTLTKMTVPPQPTRGPTRPAIHFTKLSKPHLDALRQFSKDSPRSSRSYHHEENISEMESVPEASVGVQESDDDDDIAPADCEVGEQTMMDSEGFSMVSLDSIQSVKDMAISSSPSPTTEMVSSIRSSRPGAMPKPIPFHTSRQVISGTHTSADGVYSHLLTPSSNPGLCFEDRVNGPGNPGMSDSNVQATPLVAQQPATQPPKMEHKDAAHRKVPTLEMRKVVGAGRALQGALGSPSPKSNGDTRTPKPVQDVSLLNGFSANTRRELGAGLKLGQDLAQQAEATPKPVQDESLLHGFSAKTRRELHAGLKLGEDLARHTKATPKPVQDESLLHGFSANTSRELHAGLKLGGDLARRSSCLTRPTSEPESANSIRSAGYPRLPTPLNSDHDGMAVRHPPTETMDVGYPSLTPIRNQQTRSFGSSSEMSWKPSTPPIEQSACVSPDSMEARWQRERDATSQQIQALDPSEVIAISDDSEDVSDLPVAAEEARENEQDLSKLEALFSDERNIKPRRPRIPRTWRRLSSAGFAYRDELPLGSSPQDYRSRTEDQASSRRQITPLETIQSSPPALERPKELTRSDSDQTAKGCHRPTSTPSLEEDAIDSSTEDSILTPLASPDSTDSGLSDDTGLFWHRNLPALFQKDKVKRPSAGSLKKDKLDLTSLLNMNTPLVVSPIRTPGRTPANNAMNFTPNRHTSPEKSLFPSSLRGVLKPTDRTSDIGSSHLRKSLSRVSFAGFDETREISIDKSTDLELENTSQASNGDTVASDVRQLRGDILAFHRSHPRSEEVDEDETETKMKGELDSRQLSKVERGSSVVDELSISISQRSLAVREYEIDEFLPSRSRLSLDDLRTPVRSGFVSDASQTRNHSRVSFEEWVANRPIFEGYSRPDASVFRNDGSAQVPHDPKRPGLITRFTSYLWSYVFSSAAIGPPPADGDLHLNHPLLAKQTLLPRVEPWTKTHYKTLDNIYQLYVNSPSNFDPNHPDNARLKAGLQRIHRYSVTMGPTREIRERSFAQYIDVKICNWGYSVQLSASHIMVALLFSQLLALNSIEEYEYLHRKEIQMGDCNPGTPGDDLGVDLVVLRLFSLIVGERVRRDEKLGKAIDRRPGTFWLKLQGGEWENLM